MRIPYSFFALACLAAPAFAGWEKLFEGSGLNRYADPESITLDAEGDGYRTALVLTEFKHSDEDLRKVYPDGHRSSVTLWEYDCKRNRGRELAWIGYSGRKGDGKFVNASADVTTWSKSTGNPAFEPVARFVCEFKIPPR